MQRARFLFGVFLPMVLFSAHPVGQKGHLPKQVSADKLTRKSIVSVNKALLWVSPNGQLAHDPYTGSSGLYYPNNTATCMYTMGLIWGGYCTDGSEPALRVGGQYYHVGTVPGHILPNGSRQDPNDSAARVYRIRRDYTEMTDRELLEEASLLNNSVYNDVTEEMKQAVYDRYEQDWNEWPVDWGAPFYDLNKNGQYEPELGEMPGLQNADQVLFLVVNDLDSTEVYRFSGAPPLGLELQITLWAYKDRSANALGNGVFMRHRLVNKSAAAIDSMYVGMFTDPDVGDYGDDFAGCDTVLQMSYAYNANSDDDRYRAFSFKPPAVGVRLLQGPLVEQSGSKGLFDFQLLNNYKNLPAITINYDPPCGLCEPVIGHYSQTLISYSNLQGFLPGESRIPYLIGAGPDAGKPTKFPLSGDPLTGSGDVDGLGNNYWARDVRSLLSSGPFRLEPGSAQEIITALIAAQANPQESRWPPNLAAVAELKSFADDYLQAYKQIPLLVNGSYSADFTDGLHTGLTVQMDLLDITISGTCRLHLYSTYPGMPQFDLELFDDGQHADGVAGDNIWGNTLTVDNQKYPYQTDLYFTYRQQDQLITRVLDPVSLRPGPQLDNWRVIWEDGKQDRLINNGEHLQLQFDIVNSDLVNDLDSLRLAYYSWDTEGFLYDGPLAAGESLADTLHYDLTNGSFTSQDSETVKVYVNFDGHAETVSKTFPVIQWLPDAIKGTQISVQAEQGWQPNIKAIISDPEKLTGQTYRIEITAPEGEPNWSLWNQTTGQELLNDQQPGLDFSQPYPIVDGIQWQVVSYPFFYDFLMVANGNGALSPPVGAAYPYPLWNRYLAIDYLPTSNQQANGQRWLISGSQKYLHDFGEFIPVVTLNDSLWPRIQADDYEWRFTAAGGLAADSAGNSYQVPFECWNIGSGTPDDPDDDYRMLPVLYDVLGDDHFGTADTTKYDNIPTDRVSWLKPVDTSPGSGGYEEFVLQLQNGTYKPDWQQQVLHELALFNWDLDGPVDSSAVFQPETGSVIRIITRKPLRDGDAFTVTAPAAAADHLYGLPYKWRLGQNYPNPFNGQTTIPITVAKDGAVAVHIYNVLGQLVRHFSFTGRAGQSTKLVWDGIDDKGVAVASGIYFYTLPTSAKVKPKKMIYLR